MRTLVASLLLFFSCFADENASWLSDVNMRTDPDAIQWLREKIKKDIPIVDQVDLSAVIKQPCTNCFSGGSIALEPRIFVFMSFSIPEEAWLKLSKELEECSGAFVLRGLPDNSFHELAKRLANLKQRGMKTTVLIDPNLFRNFQIQNVPSFVFVDGNENNKISGNISLEYALSITGNHLKGKGD